VFHEEWEAFGWTDLEASDFTLHGEGGPPHPDFSATGSAFQLGYRSGNTSIGALLTREGGVDNWSVTVNPGAVGVQDPLEFRTWGRTKTIYR
jgi:hypothetical protein